MTILITLIVFYLIVLQCGKVAQKLNYLGYFFICFITIIQVGLVILLLFTMETPNI